MSTVVIGFIFGTGILLYSLTGAAANSKLYLDVYSVILVVGGTISASLMSITFKNLKEMILTVKATFTKNNDETPEIIRELVLISEKAFKVNKFSNLNHESKNEYIQKGLRLLQSELGPNEIRKIMAENILTDKNRINQNADIIKSMAKYPPSFGMVGTILGLIGLLEDMSISASMDKIGIKMAMALVTTLYGLLVSNYMLLPLAEVIVNKSHSELKLKKTILEVFILISGNKNDPVMVKEFLGVLNHASTESHETGLSEEAA